MKKSLMIGLFTICSIAIPGHAMRSAAITEASLQNLGVGSGQLPFGVSQQIGVMKCRAGDAAREECGTR